MAKWLLPTLIGAWLACASSQQSDRYSIIYEQSGGLGGIREFRLAIDSNGYALLERWSGWHDTSSVQWQLSPADRAALTAAIERAVVFALDSTATAPDLRPDAPLRVLIIGSGQLSRRIAIGTPAPDQLRHLANYLDSLATHIGTGTHR
ncbi:MAG: hypothetical protein KatS3mg039_0018 [Candidatus Kapaibacterium sp.]|nr:MAG: hypothetical protein KatS3mg039_0018 [Candidatus Kapabacteria bacterium]